MINRGNLRQDLFSGAGTAQAFEKTLFETCERGGWGRELGDLNEVEWEVLLTESMKALGKTESDVRVDKKSAE